MVENRWRIRTRNAMYGAIICFSCFVMALGFSSPVLAATTTSQAEPVKIRFVMSHRDALLGSIASHLADKNGYFSKYGVEVEFISGGGGGTTLRLLSTGDVDLAQGGLPAAILAALRDPRIAFVGTFYSSANAIQFLAPATSGIRSIADLAGKVVGYTSEASATQYLAEESIRRAGIEGVKFRSIGNFSDNWVAAQADLIAAGPAMQPFIGEKVKTEGAVVVIRPADYVKHYAMEGFAVNKKFAAAHPEAVKGVFLALHDAIEYMRANPEAAAKAGMQLFHDTSYDVILAGIQDYIASQTLDMHLDKEAIAETIRGMVKNKQLKETVSVDQVLDQSYWPAQFRIKE